MIETNTFISSFFEHVVRQYEQKHMYVSLGDVDKSKLWLQKEFRRIVCLSLGQFQIDRMSLSFDG